MKKRIVSFGDSFVWGTELQNNPDGTKAWAGIAAQQLDADYKTLAIPGCGNENISRQVLSYFSQNPHNNCLAVINWTWALRWDFYIVNTESWVTLGPTCVPARLEQHLSQDEAQRLVNFYQDYTGKSILWDRYRTLQTMYMIQQYLKSNNIRNIQTYMDYELFGTAFHAPDYIQALQSLVQPELTNFDGLNFVDWSKKNKFEVTDPGLHPLEDAHIAACKYWVDKYRRALEE